MFKKTMEDDEDYDEMEEEEKIGEYEDFCVRCNEQYHTFKTCPKKNRCYICKEKHSFYQCPNYE